MLVAPRFLWLALMAGFAGGYVSYEFREFLRAIPRAFQLALEKVGPPTTQAWDSMITWLLRPHPFIYPGLLTVPFAAPWVSKEFMTGGQTSSLTVYAVFGLILLEVFLAVNAIVLFLVFLGAREVEKKYWIPFFFGTDQEMFSEARLIRNGYKEEQLTYVNAVRWMLEGVGLLLFWVGFLIWRYVFEALWNGIGILALSCYYLFRFVHSEKRLLCGIDAALGGILSYWFLYSSSSTLGEWVVVVFCGGILGAVCGIVNWEIISKRILHVDAPVVHPT